MRRPLNIGIIGYGAIGKTLYQAINEGQAGNVKCLTVLVRNPRTTPTPSVVTHDSDVFHQQPFSLAIECAGHEAVRELGEGILRRADLMVTSVGVLSDDILFQRLHNAAKRTGHKLIIPSAGIGALDTLTAAATDELTNVTITVRKNIAAWYGTPAEQQFDLKPLRSAVTIYEGPVREGAMLYPANVNISAAVALAGIGFDKTRLRIIADPTITTHVVEVEAIGAFGRFHFMEDVIPDSNNPKTGKIVALALIKTVRQLASELVIGG